MPKGVELKEERLMPLDAVHQYAYCPRRAYLMHHDGRWEENAYTADGSLVHRRVDESDEVLDSPTGEDEPPRVARSVTLSSDSLGVIAKLDLVEAQNDEAVPVETKRGKVPDNPEQSWEPERVQLMAQALLLREAGFRSEKGYLYFAGSKKRVEVRFDESLRLTTINYIRAAQIALEGETIPGPLIDSPKCRGCSLGGICLPDETHALQTMSRSLKEASDATDEVRRFYPARDDAVPFYVQEQGAFVGKDGDGLSVTKGGKVLGKARVIDVSQLVICGNITISAQALHLCAESGIPVVHLSMGNWFYGITQGFVLRNAFDRAAQFDVASKPERCLILAKSFVLAKGRNQRTFLRRNSRTKPDEVLRSMSDTTEKIKCADSLGALLGLEGAIASAYFSSFGDMLRVEGAIPSFDWTCRNRRPPRDPINAMLSFGYALLAKECSIALAAVGLDPFWGFYHQPRHGRPALALDLMEEFRPIVVDSAVLTAINNGMVHPRDFEIGASGCLMSGSARKSFIKAYEGRLDQLATHPVFNYRCSWRRIIAMQAQLLARHLRGELAEYQGVEVR